MMVGQAVAFAPNYNKAKVAATKIFMLLERKPQIDSSTGTGLRLVNFVFNVIGNLSFLFYFYFYKTNYLWLLLQIP